MWNIWREFFYIYNSNLKLRIFIFIEPNSAVAEVAQLKDELGVTFHRCCCVGICWCLLWSYWNILLFVARQQRSIYWPDFCFSSEWRCAILYVKISVKFPSRDWLTALQYDYWTEASVKWATKLGLWFSGGSSSKHSATYYLYVLHPLLLVSPYTCNPSRSSSLFYREKFSLSIT